MILADPLAEFTECIVHSRCATLSFATLPPVVSSSASSIPSYPTPCVSLCRPAPCMASDRLPLIGAKHTIDFCKS